MTHLSARAAALAAATCTALAAFAATPAQAQYVAYSPVVAAPVVAAPAPVVVAPRLGLFDRWRLRRWGWSTPVVAAPAYTAAYAPAYTAGYAPAYTAAYAPAYTAAYAPAYTAAYAPAYTAAYAPAPRYLTSYAPLQRAVVQTSYMPVTAAPSCSSCATTSYAPVTTTAYAPTTVYQSAQLAPVVAAPACSTCAAYPAEAPCSSCSTCATGSGNVIYGTPGGDPATPPPQLPLTPEPAETGYPLNGPEADPAESAFGAPALLGPMNDNQASRVSVDVHTAVYRRPASSTAVSTTVAKPAAKLGVDTGAWSSTIGQ